MSLTLQNHKAINFEWCRIPLNVQFYILCFTLILIRFEDTAECLDLRRKSKSKVGKRHDLSKSCLSTHFFPFIQLFRSCSIDSAVLRMVNWNPKTSLLLIEHWKSQPIWFFSCACAEIESLSRIFLTFLLGCYFHWIHHHDDIMNVRTDAKNHIKYRNIIRWLQI